MNVSTWLASVWHSEFLRRDRNEYSRLCATWKALRKPCSPSSILFFFFKKRTRCGVNLLFTFVILNVKPFWLALCVLVSVSSLSWIQCLVSVYCILCISSSLLLLLLLLFIIFFLNRSATLASAFWKTHCFSPSLFKVMLLRFSAPSREKCWTSWQF